MLVGKRRRLLKYLQASDIDRYRALIERARPATVIEPGAHAPDFTLRDQDGQKVSLADFRGGIGGARLLPGRLQPGLHRPAERLPGGARRARGARRAPGGHPVDGAFCHKAFQAHLSLTIPLLADFHPKGEVARAYGVWSEDYGISSRALVLVGPGGKVEWSLPVAAARGSRREPDL